MTEQEPLRLTDDQRSILDWLASETPGAGEAYETALNLIARGPMTGAGSLLAHCLRDLLNRLAQASAGPRSEQVQYRALVKGLVDAIDSAGFSTHPPESGDSASATMQIPVSVVGSLHRLVTDFRRGTARATSMEVSILVGLFGERGAQSEYAPARSVLRGIKDWAEAKAHFALKARNVPFEEAAEQVRTFERLATALLRKFYDQVKDIDAILDSANA